MTEVTWSETDDDRGTDNCDSISARLELDVNPPPGLILHTAGFTGGGVFRIATVWSSEEDWRRFRSDQLMPAVRP